MKCYLHTEEEIVAQCQACTRGLCSECSEQFQSPTCHNCEIEQNRQYRSILIRKLLISGGLFFLIFTSMLNDHKNHQPALFCFLVAYAAASVPWGWSVLNRITPNVFLILPFFGWLIYFGVKFYIAGMVGFFIAPFRIYKSIQEIREISKAQATIMTGQPATLTLIK